MSVPELAAQNFGVKVTSTVPVVAERAMYFGLGATGFIGGTASVGAPGLSTRWLFAEGAAAPGFHTFYLLMNPNPFPIDVHARPSSSKTARGSTATITVPRGIAQDGLSQR